MKITASTKGLLISLGVCIAAFAIYFLFLAKKNEYLIDNPTNDTYYFKINNGNEQTIASGQYFKVDLNKGKNNIQVFDKQKKLLYDSAFEVKKYRGLINITHQDYFVHTQYYGYNIKKDSLLLTLDKTNIDNELYLGSPKKFNSLYTEAFYYNIDEKYDAIVKNVQKVESRSKIFRKQDFLNYYKEYYPSK
ncbi:hypothetical protein [Frigoriflavimonas asaccharolytica]|uniref:Uncharacterized protein n=1 Tax=Frigoriflavimonas asaccharolytica TaxID=2735899 RepID=A0A8J8G713_9FLAO|nr:hypothetical protein [Frigoriflavimonas asaccharolytica]NRS91865.1 hypothetical protein [Frigoriflavimonas asaccharolytica]